MKKIIAVFLSLIMAISLFACDTSDDSVMTYKGNFFGEVMNLVVDGDKVTATLSQQYVEDGVNVTFSIALIDGKASVSGSNLSADFSDVTYEMLIKLSGGDVDAYIEETKEHLLSSVETEADKQLVNDLLAGKPVKFGKESALSAIVENFVSLKATVNSSKGTALFTEIKYETGYKYVFEYYDNGNVKSESYYKPDGTLDYKDEFENTAPENDGENGKTEEKPSQTQTPNNQENHESNDKHPDVTDNETDKQPDDGNVVIGGNSTYPVGIYTGVYEEKDAILEIKEDGTPILKLKFKGEMDNVIIEQNFTITNGRLHIGNEKALIIDFGVDEIKYVSSMKISGSGASEYISSMLKMVNESDDMTVVDKQIYRDLLNGKEVTFGKEAYIYNGVKLHTIHFDFKENGTFEAKEVQVVIGGGTSSGNGGSFEYDDSFPGSSGSYNPPTNDPEADINNGGNGGINLNDGVLFYMIGTFKGQYSGMDAVIDFPENRQPVLTLKVEMREGDAVINQTIKVEKGKLIYHNSVLAIIDFTVEDILYTMSMTVNGSGAAEYKQKILSDVESSNMSDSDKTLYKFLLNGKEVKFGKKSELYQGIKLPMIKFLLDGNTLSFTSERFNPDESTSGKIETDSSSSIEDDLLNIGGKK